MPLDSRRLKELFNAAVELPEPPDRLAFLERECRGDPELRQRLFELLAAHELPASELERHLAANIEGARIETEPDPATAGSEPPANADDQTLSHHHETPAPATLIGAIIAERYKLRQEIGEGGMGSVFLAEQTQPVKRQVALKLIKPGMDSKAVLARFESERQALALMDHPNIAKVFDAGTTEGGRPFFVMELVKGIPLTEYCDAHRVGLPERLTLFRLICSAVQHAHQKGIIHRDLKPTNILVESHDGEPVPKIIDFGLAKATSGIQLTDHSLFTAFGTVAGTPLYMAPEQASFNALDIDTRADVYALGVILYELLTGSTPIRRDTIRRAAFDEMLRLIREFEPPTPSSRISECDTLPSIAATRQTEPARLGRFVRGELDWIVMKALAKERNRRYESATALAQDLERFTNHEPVTAGPPTAAYRIRKFARRHRAALATAAAFALLLVVATALSAALAIWANRERVRALSAEQTAKEQQGRAQDREKMAIDAVKRYGEVVRDTPELKNTPSLSNLRGKLLKEPREFFKKLRDRLQADRETTPDSLHKLATASFDLGMLANEIGDKQDALRAYQESLAIHERLAREKPSDAEYQRRLAASYHNIGMLESEAGRTAEALESYEQARAIRERLAREHPESPNFASNLGATLNNMAMIDLDQRQFDKARAKLIQAIAWQRKALATNANHPTYRQFLAKHLRNLLQAAEGLSSVDEADQARRELSELAASDPAKAALDARLTAVLKGNETLRNDPERIVFAYLAHAKAFYAFSAHLFAEALANDPKLGDDRQAQHRYNAACAAALAGSGQGKDHPPPDDAAKAMLRRQTLDWLQAELVAWTRVFDSDPAAMKAKISPTLKHWKADTDLAGIREEKELARLPEKERAAFHQLWNDVDQLLTRAAGGK